MIALDIGFQDFQGLGKKHVFPEIFDFKVREARPFLAILPYNHQGKWGVQNHKNCSKMAKNASKCLKLHNYIVLNQFQWNVKKKKFCGFFCTHCKHLYAEKYPKMLFFNFEARFLKIFFFNFNLELLIGKWSDWPQIWYA